MSRGYYQFPALWEKQLYFIAQDAVWAVSIEGGRAERLTSRMPGIKHLVVGKEGLAFAYQGDVHALTHRGGESCRLTFHHAGMRPVGFHHGALIIASSHEQPFSNISFLYTRDAETGVLTRLFETDAEHVSYSQEKGCVIQRLGYGYINWKRYQGGTAGTLWIDRGDRIFSAFLSTIKHNVLQPIWIGERIYFLSDFKGKGD